MKVTYTAANGRLAFEFDAPTTKDAVEKLELIQDVFEEKVCGVCGSERIRFDVREFDGNRYYKLVCECRAQFDFGQYKDQAKGLFGKRHKGEGHDRQALPNRGWYIWQGEGAGPVTPQRTQSAPATDVTQGSKFAAPPASKPAPAPSGPSGRLTVDQKHEEIVRGMRNANNRWDLDQVAKYAKTMRFSERQTWEQEEAYRDALDRISRQSSRST